MAPGPTKPKKHAFRPILAALTVEIPRTPAASASTPSSGSPSAIPCWLSVPATPTRISPSSLTTALTTASVLSSTAGSVRGRDGSDRGGGGDGDGDEEDEDDEGPASAFLAKVLRGEAKTAEDEEGLVEGKAKI